MIGLQLSQLRKSPTTQVTVLEGIFVYNLRRINVVCHVIKIP